MKRTTPITFVLAIALALLGCGQADTTAERAADPPGDTTLDAAFPMMVEGANGTVTLDAAPARIVSLAPSLTETLFAVGAGDQVIAVDDQSNYPDEAPTTSLSGYEPNLEAIGDYDPDLVIASNDLGDLVAGLDAIGVPVLVIPAAENLEDAYQQIELIGAMTGHGQTAEELVEDMRTRIEELRTQVPDGPAVSYFHELDDTLYTITSQSFIGELYDMAGFENVADAADPDGTGYPQLSAEYLLQEDPQAIFLADTKCCGQTPATVAARPGWSTLQAVRNGNVFELDDNIASRWGPRVVDLFESLIEARLQLVDGA